MSQPIPIQKRVVRANGTDLSGEIRGYGPAVLFLHFRCVEPIPKGISGR